MNMRVVNLPASPAPEVRILPTLQGSDYRDYRRRAIFHCHKWDPQVEDVATIAPFALALPAAQWRWLAQAAEGLAAETIACESELWERPDLHRELGIPWTLRAALALGRRSGLPVAAARVMRFDFHPAADGWRLSEVNSDVPGGFNEASGLTALMAEHHRGLLPAGDPARAVAWHIAQVAQQAPVALVHCTSYSDDRQVMEFIADRLRECGVRCVFCAPDALRWRGLHACGPDGAMLGALMRFFPAEWLPQLPLATRWWRLFAGAATPAANPGSALLSQGKRLALLWDRLATPCPTWRALLPETLEAAAMTTWDEGWLLKPAWGRVGEGVLGPGFGLARDWQRARRDARRRPRAWLAQRRFASVPIMGDHGPLHACLGVYTVDGQAAGIYARVCATPPIDHRAQEVAVLIDPVRQAEVAA